MNTLEKVQKNLENFSKSERKVAEVIMASPQTAIHSSIATLAKMADVSEPTVNRFCRRLDTKGFPDFKLHLAQSLANGTPYVNRNVEEDDGPDAYTHKIFESTMACLDVAKNSLDSMQINRAVDLLTQAKRISFFGLGASSAVARDAQNKFIRFNIPITCFDDIVMGANVFLIRESGRKSGVVELEFLESVTKHRVFPFRLDVLIPVPDASLKSEFDKWQKRFNFVRSVPGGYSLYYYLLKRLEPVHFHAQQNNTTMLDVAIQKVKRIFGLG